MESRMVWTNPVKKISGSTGEPMNGAKKFLVFYAESM